MPELTQGSAVSFTNPADMNRLAPRIDRTLPHTRQDIELNP